jgi:hypothetical protein
MNAKRPDRRSDSNAGAGDSSLVVIDAVLLPPDQDPYGGVRMGRPVRTAEEIAALGISDSVFVEFTDPPPAGN